MSQLIAIIFIVFTGTLTLLSSLGQLLVKNKRFENYNLWALFLLISLQFFQVALALYSDIVFSYPPFMFLHLTALYLLGVIFYFAYTLVCKRKEPLPQAKYLYFIPSGAALVFDIIFLAGSRDEQVLILKYLYNAEPYKYGFLIKLLFLGAGIQCMILLGKLLKDILIKLKKDRSSLVLTGITITYIILSAAAINLITISYAAASRGMISAVYISIGFLMIATFLLSHRYPSFFQLVWIDTSGKRYSRSGLDGLDIDEIKRKLKDLMEKEKLFTEENISLLDLADELSISSHQLSRFLNEQMNMSFYSFINNNRVKEAIRLFNEDKDLTVLSVAYAVGFNSKSSFYSAFFKFTGKTPNQFRKSCLK